MTGDQMTSPQRGLAAEATATYKAIQAGLAQAVTGPVPAPG
jgi:hypothetical protein